jgi:transcriptional regulator with XRE-family HTH domain
LCPACTQAAQKTVSWPLWLFDSPLLRRALAQLNVPAVPAIVRAACGLSQRDLAGIVGWSPAALSYYERGQRDAVFDIRAVLQFADALGMPRAALLPLILADPDAGLAAGAGSGTGMDVDGVVSVAWPLALRLLSSCPPPAPRPGSAVPICGTGRRVRTRCTSGTAWSAGPPCSSPRCGNGSASVRR